MNNQNLDGDNINNSTRRDFLYRSGIIAVGAMWAPSILAAGDSQSIGAAAKTPKMKFSLMSYTFARRGWRKDGKFDIAGMCKVGEELKIDAVDMVTTYGLEPSFIRKTAADHGQKIICYTFFPDICKSTAEERKAGLDEVKKGLEIAKALETDMMMIHTPGKSEFSSEVCLDNWIAGLGEAIELTKAAGVQLTIESVGWSPLAKSVPMLRAVKEVPGLKLVFDNGNVYCSGEDSLDFYKACKEHIVHAHFKDGHWWEETKEDGQKKRHYSNELIGEGDIDQVGCLQLMKDAGYSGYIDIEYENDKYMPDEAMRKAVEYLREKMEMLK